MDEDKNYVPLTETPEWKKAKAKRGAPRGAHIRNKPDPAEPIEMSREELFEHLLALAEGDMNVPGVKFDRSISLGTVLTIIPMLIGSYIAYGEYTASKRETAGQIHNIENTIVAMQKASDDRVRIYAPAIEDLKRSNEVQDTRFQNMVASQSRLTDMQVATNANVTKLVESVAQMHEDMAVSKAQAGRDKRTELILPPTH